MGLLRKRGCDLVERLAGKATTRQPPEGLWAVALALLEPPSSVEFRLQRGYGLGSGFGRDQTLPQVGSNRSIAVPAACHQFGARLCEPGVVDEPGAIQSRERVGARTGRVPRTREPPLELSSRPPARGKRSSGPRQRARSPNLACKLPRSGPIERPPDGEPCPHDRIGRQDTPRLSVELDGDPAALSLAQPGYGRSHASASAAANASAATSALPFVAADSSAATGSSRADTT